MNEFSDMLKNLPNYLTPRKITVRQFARDARLSRVRLDRLIAGTQRPTVKDVVSVNETMNQINARLQTKQEQKADKLKQQQAVIATSTPVLMSSPEQGPIEVPVIGSADDSQAHFARGQTPYIQHWDEAGFSDPNTKNLQVEPDITELAIDHADLTE